MNDICLKNCNRCPPKLPYGIRWFYILIFLYIGIFINFLLWILSDSVSKVIEIDNEINYNIFLVLLFLSIPVLIFSLQAYLKSKTEKLDEFVSRI